MDDGWWMMDELEQIIYFIIGFLNRFLFIVNYLCFFFFVPSSLHSFIPIQYIHWFTVLYLDTWWKKPNAIIRFPRIKASFLFSPNLYLTIQSTNSEPFVFQQTNKTAKKKPELTSEICIAMANQKNIHFFPYLQSIVDMSWKSSDDLWFLRLFGISHRCDDFLHLSFWKSTRPHQKRSISKLKIDLDLHTSFRVLSYSIGDQSINLSISKQSPVLCVDLWLPLKQEFEMKMLWKIRYPRIFSSSYNHSRERTLASPFLYLSLSLSSESLWTLWNSLRMLLPTITRGIPMMMIWCQKRLR